MSYRELKSYQQAVIIYDYTVEFCDRYVRATDKSDKSYRSNRTTDQMVQAARSGKQNIVEGSTERTSEKGELKLLGVARASFQELLEDYEDFLRQRGLRQWGKDDPEAKAVRGLVYRSDRTDKTNKSDKSDRTYWTYRSYLDEPETAANAAICLIHQVNFLLDRQIRALEEQFVKEGGWTERLFQKRIEERKRQIWGR
ncbi:four helix bundle protein [Candidatus Parcubacteria bacterium]|nr:four helix bundle protein [Candidatus Parcubacteria bacterium]